MDRIVEEYGAVIISVPVTIMIIAVFSAIISKII